MVLRQNGGMETTFYDEQYPSNLPVEHIKRTLTLDLGAGRYGKRRNVAAPLLSTPEVNMVNTPDIEKLIIQNGFVSTATPTPGSGVLFHSSSTLPQPTEEQEQYARGFMDALEELRNTNDSSSSGRALYHDLDHCPMPIKDEPQTVPSSSSSPGPMSPINMESQERIKLERKRQRNRVAASKCRKRKLERISRLEDKVKVLKGENGELAAMVLKLKDHVYRLKEQVMEHVNSGCAIDQQF